MIKKKIQTIGIILYLLIAITTYPIQAAHTLNNASPPIVSLINPGPDGYPVKWTASTNPRSFGTSDFIFYSNETSAGSTFFMNVSVNNVENLIGWGIGIAYDKTILSYSSAWRPSDHVFKSIEEKGWDIVAPDVTFTDINATHKLLMWGCTYVTPEEEEPWTFNGSGTLCQIQFKIVKDTLAETFIEWDQEWTAVYYYPGIKQIPTVKNAFFKYFAESSQDAGAFWILVIAVIAVIAIIVVGAIVLNFKLKSKKILRGGKKG
ncbi:MAG: hypothetical protein QHH18_04735 [Candidatus Bathyarchaeota archaeon]|jgi:hypothetical protein|nr:hypothetical protein [Candidatus Bathyarchaeota archaeon A05DMB-5]MDH7557895.1 hypothetical protein [Candidatus Bathyarchaeota archaeon]